MNDIDWGLIGAILFIMAVVGSIVLAVMKPYFEVKAFNECTGGHATYFTAAFTELRVQDCKNK